MADFNIDPQILTPVYEQIITQVKQGILSKELDEGDNLPSIRQLATDLELNPNTIAKSYKSLEKDGLIETARAKGTFIAQGSLQRLQVSQKEKYKNSISNIVTEMKSSGLSRSEIHEVISSSIKDCL